MYKKSLIKISNNLWIHSLKKDNNEFIKSINDVKKIQLAILDKIIKNNKNTKFGIKYKFSEVENYASFCKKVPLSEYEDYKIYINQILNGEENILTKEKVILLEPTSGSTKPSKFIPYTISLKQEFQRGINPWIYDIYTNFKDLSKGTAYWSITPLIHRTKKESKVPIGFEEDTKYLNLFSSIIIKNILSVPSEIKRIKNLESFRYITQLFLLTDENLSFISIWSPSFLDFLFKDLETNLHQIIIDLKNKRINNKYIIEPGLKTKIEKKISINEQRLKTLERIEIEGVRSYQELFPNLKVISCWTEGFAKEHLSKIKQNFPKVTIQPKGLIATEAFISFPLFNQKGSILAINSHFLEFENKGVIYLSHDLKKNKVYSIIVTTSGGLYRYKLHDLIKVVGFYKKVPLIKFVGKEDYVSDLFGEKLNINHVNSIFKKLLKLHKLDTQFYFLAPDKNSDYFYTLFIQSAENNQKLIKFKEQFEKELRMNYHYNYCRELTQLNELRLYKIEEDANKKYIEHYSKSKKLGDIKVLSLDKNMSWSSIFKGGYV